MIQDKGIAEIIIGKQRMGETGVIRALFQGEFSRFRNLSEEAKANIARAHQEEQADRNIRPFRKSRGIE